MRPAALSTPPPATAAGARDALPPKSDWRTLAKLLPYVWAWRWRVLVALACLVAAKLANIGVPLVLKNLVDALALKPGDPRTALVVPVQVLAPPTVVHGTLQRSAAAARWPARPPPTATVPVRTLGDDPELRTST